MLCNGMDIIVENKNEYIFEKHNYTMCVTYLL